MILGSLFIILNSCILRESTISFRQNYICDSINVPTYNFVLENDSAAYSPMDKEPFDFHFELVKDYIRINNKRYYYILGGLKIDTIGLVSITNGAYLYKKNKNSNKNGVLFNFNRKVNDTWKITADGYFNDYEVRLKNIKYDKTLEDTIYSFSYNFLGQKFPNGYYFENFKVSKHHGILSFSFNNGVECNCIIEE